MTSFIKSAKQFINVENNEIEIEIKYDKYLEGFGYETFVDHFNTNLIGSNNIYTMHNNGKSIRYEQFLNTMVNNTTETLRKSVSIQLENVLFENRNIFSLIRIMNSVKILDRTFIPPLINPVCSWQKRMVKEFCLTTFPDIIKTSTNNNRLQKLFRVLQLIEEDMQY
jgi:hypothetical protein|tara:strand:+ start:6832 stop:7332 length:501 start_codon:yes stop_codon:yes gene_type:complete